MAPTIKTVTMPISHVLMYLVFSQSLRIALSRPMPRIIGGQDATPGTYPFFVSLTISNSPSCGGSLIAPDLVLTAAHCFGLETAEIGRSTRVDPSEPYETFNLTQEIRHPVYNDDNYKYDFMILQLDGQASTPFKPIRLNQIDSIPQIGVEEGVKAIGFGVTEYYYDGSLGGVPDTLQEVSLRAISNEECIKSEATEISPDAFQGGYANLISPDMLCATEEGRDTCAGDSGGPLLIQEGGEYIQVGITSWGFGCGKDNFPGVYSRVSNQYQWIKGNVCDLSSNPPAEYECDAPTPPPARDVQVTIAISFDDFPDEISLMVVDDTGYGVTHVEFPDGSFAASIPQSTFHYTTSMKERSTYTFIITDSGDDGLCCYQEGSYMVYVGTETSQGMLLASGGGNFGTEMVHQFTIPELGSDEEAGSEYLYTTEPSSVLSPAPSSLEEITPSPTAAPSLAPTTERPSTAPTITASNSPTVSPSPTSTPSKAPSDSPTSSPSVSMAPSEVPTTVRQPKEQRISIIFGVLVVVIVAALFFATSWYADRHARLNRIQAETPLVQKGEETERFREDGLRRV